MDGISQPGVEGFTKTLKPGRAMVSTGKLLLGMNGDSDSRPAWSKGGSFLVFRQLEQLVPEFNKYLTDNTIVQPGLTVQQGADLLGARMIGRWKSVRRLSGSFSSSADGYHLVNIRALPLISPLLSTILLLDQILTATMISPLATPVRISRRTKPGKYP
jgi:hypothetical protein